MMDCFDFNRFTDEELEQLFSKIKYEREERANKKRDSKKEELNKLLKKAFDIITKYDFIVEIYTDEENCINKYSGGYKIF